MFRRFGRLQIRNLLYKQDQLAELERKLYKLDLKEGDQLNLSSRRHDQNEDRKTVVAEIDAKLKEYGRLQLTLSYYALTLSVMDLTDIQWSKR